MKKIKEYLGSLPMVLFLVITVCVFMPSSLFLGNLNEFSVGYIEVLPIILIVSLVVMLVLAGIGAILHRLSRKAETAYKLLLFGISAGFYLQGNFLNPSFPELNGTPIEWSNYTKSTVLSLGVWGICIVAPFVAYRFKKNITEMIASYGSMFLAAMQALSLVMLVFTAEPGLDTTFALTKKGQFELSKNDNVVMFVVDTLDATWAERDVLSNEAYSEKLKDFTYFNDVVASGAPTVLGVPGILTGYRYDTTKDLIEYNKEAYANTSLFKDMSESGYDVKLYTEKTYVDGADRRYIANSEDIDGYQVSSYVEFGSYLYRLAGFYAAPMPLKRFFWFYSGEFSSLSKVDELENEVYELDDPQFYKDMQQSGVNASQDNNVFAVYHFFGAHGPYSMDENAQAVSQDKTSQTQQIHGTFKIIFEYIDQMKSLGIYDNSTIIITADHGGVNLYQNPAVLVKQKGATNDVMEVNSNPATFKNLNATIAKVAVNNKDSYGETLFEVSAENKDSVVRYHVAPDDLGLLCFPDDITVKSKTYCMYKIVGNSRDMNNITPVKSLSEMKKVNSN